MEITVFTGSGISKESGINTFRDSKNGIWENVSIDDVCTPQALKRNRKLVLDFYNDMRKKLKIIQPNSAHTDLAKLEENHNVTIITQNIDNLHERAGSTNVLHLHGELTKARGQLYEMKASPMDSIINIGYKDISINDVDPVSGAKLRPHVVFFGEYPYNVLESTYKIKNADILIIIGTSFSIGYTIDMISKVKKDCKIYYIDPSPSYIFENKLNIEYIKEVATIGVKKAIKMIQE